MDAYTKEALSKLIAELYAAMVEAGVTEEQIEKISQYFGEKVLKVTES